ncbi:MAG: hypothetical protein ACRC1Z_25695 [Waterburya sp.]
MKLKHHVSDVKTGKKLRDADPEGFREIVARAIAVQGRVFWNADEEKLEKLRELYESTEDEAEEVTV